MIKIEFSQSNIEFIEKYQNILSTYRVETINFSRNLTTPLDDKKIAGGVYYFEKLLYIFINPMPHQLQIFSLINEMELLKDAFAVLIDYFTDNNIEFSGFSTKKDNADLLNQILVNKGINTKLSLSMDIMKLDKLNIKSLDKYVKLDHSFNHEIKNIYKLFFIEALNQEPSEENIVLAVDKFINDEVIYGIIDEEKKVIANVVARKISNFYNLSFVYTKPEHRKKGYAKKLLASLINDLLKEVSFVSLFVDKLNPVSNKVYLDLGFNYIIDNFVYIIEK